MASHVITDQFGGTAGTATVSRTGGPLAAGDLLIALVYYPNTLTLSGPPAGWNLEASGSSGSDSYGIYSHTAAAGEGVSSWTFTGTAAEVGIAILGIRGAGSFRIGTITTGTTSATAPSMTALATDVWSLIYVAGRVTTNFWNWNHPAPIFLELDKLGSPRIAMQIGENGSNTSQPPAPGATTAYTTTPVSGSSSTTSVGFQVMFGGVISSRWRAELVYLSQ